MVETGATCLPAVRAYTLHPKTRNQKLVCTLFWIAIFGGLVYLFVWGFPKLVDDVIIPLTDKVEKTLTHAEVALIMAAAAILLPAVFVTYGPFVWVGSVILGFWLCLVVLLGASTIGMWIPFELGRRLLRERVVQWIEHRPNWREILAAVDRVGPFRLQLLLRLGPVPSHFLNYASGVPRSMTLVPYICGSALGMLPYHVMLVYFGRSIKGISALLKGESMPLAQIIYNVVAIIASIVFLVGGYLYGKSALEKIRREQEELEEQAASGSGSAMHWADNQTYHQQQERQQGQGQQQQGQGQQGQHSLLFPGHQHQPHLQLAAGVQQSDRPRRYDAHQP